MTDFAPLSTARRWALGSGDKPPASLGRFELKKQLGRGAQATVWLALDPRLQREVAIKLMRPMQDQAPSVLEQWLREARHVGRLAHPCIVPVFEADVQGAQPYIVFEYVPGSTLAEHLAQQGRCTPHDAVALMVDVLDGLHAAHPAGIVHRDLKPSNIMIDAHRHARVMDFGMAAPVQAAPDAQLASGTPAYMAPEAAAGAAPTPAMDVYSAGLVLIEMLTWRQLGIGKKPCAFLDVDGFYAQLIGMIDHMVEERFLHPEQRHDLWYGDDAGQMLAWMRAYSPAQADKWFDEKLRAALR